MKKLLIALVLVFFCTQGYAQFYVGGTFGFSYSNLKGLGGMGGFDDFYGVGDGNGYDDDDYSSPAETGASFKLLPEIGYHLSLSTAVGASFGYIKGYAALGSFDIQDYKALLSTLISTAADTQSKDGGYHAIRVAPYLRYTVVRKGGFEIFADAVAGINFIMDRSSETNYLSMELCLRPGVSFAISDSVKLLAKLGSAGFQHFRNTDGDIKLTRLGVDIDGSNLMLGAAFYF
jgi:hypothetical protein